MLSTERLISALTALLLFSFYGCSPATENQEARAHELQHSNTGVELIVLGTVQDAGSPHAACTKACCKDLFEHPDPTRKVVSLGIIDHDNDKTYLIEASPDMTTQMMALQQAGGGESMTPDGIFITHGHIGHYTGLMYLGKEAMNASRVPTYVMPRMQDYLTNDGPWSQLVSTGNIDLIPMQADSIIKLAPQLSITPILVPHRDEYSETVGFLIKGPQKTVLFIPDIDKWHLWDRSIVDMLREVDYAYLDATFYDGAELGNRDMATIPHPFVVESMELFAGLGMDDRAKVQFIHLNHTNALLDTTSTQYHQVTANGYHVASHHQRHDI